MHKYVIEMEGYNDGHPYPISSGDDLESAKHSLKVARYQNDKVRYRLIKVEVGFSDEV